MVENPEEENSMKVVIDARESGTSTGRYIDKLIENLANLSVPYQIVLLTKSARVDYLRSIAPKFKVVESNYKEFTFAQQLGLLRQIKSLRPDLVHFGMIHQPIFYGGKVVTTMHDLTTGRFRNPGRNWIIFKFKQLVYRRVIRIVAHKSLKVLTPTEYVKEDIAKFAAINASKIVVTYESSDFIKDKPETLEQVKQDDQFIMYVGRPLPHKNLERMIQAFIKLKEKHPELKLVLVGKADVLYERLRKYGESQGAKDVIFTGFVSEGQLRWLYEHTAVYVFPSLSEGFGLPPLEALQHGAPIASSNATCIPEVIGEAAHYFNPVDVDDIATKVNDVLTKPALRAELGKKGKIQIKKYSWRRMAEQTLEVYKQVLEQK